MTERNDVPPFADHDTAGRQLAQHLLAKREREPAFRPDLVLAIPRGGVAVAAPVAAALDLP